MVAVDRRSTRATSFTLNIAGEGMGSSETARMAFLSPASFSVPWGSIGAFWRGKGAKPGEGASVEPGPESRNCEGLIEPDTGSNPSDANSHGRGRRFETCCAHSAVPGFL